MLHQIHESGFFVYLGVGFGNKDTLVIKRFQTQDKGFVFFLISHITILSLSLQPLGCLPYPLWQFPLKMCRAVSRTNDPMRWLAGGRHSTPSLSPRSVTGCNRARWGSTPEPLSLRMSPTELWELRRRGAVRPLISTRPFLPVLPLTR